MEGTKIIRRLVTVVGSLGVCSLLTFCKSTEFQSQYVPPEKMVMSCETKPAGAVLPGSPLSIIVTGAEDYKGRVQQTITGPEPMKVMLTQEGGSFSREDRGENVYHFSKEGNYTVSLKGVDYDVDLQGSCRFTVFNRCPSGSQRIGVNVAFVVDNSGSHSKSDCPQPIPIGKDEAGNELSQCGVETNRERSVAYATSILGELGQQGDSSHSFVSFATFPTTSSLNSKWYNASDDFGAFSERLKVLRSPKGITPYNEGIQEALELFAQVKDQTKKNILVFVTDGFPTDKDPRETLRLAQTLRKLGVEIVAVMVTGKGSQELLREMHKGFILKHFHSSWKAAHYKDYPSYFNALLGDGSSASPGLLHAMSDSVIYIENSSELKNKVDAVVTREALLCQ